MPCCQNLAAKSRWHQALLKYSEQSLACTSCEPKHLVFLLPARIPQEARRSLCIPRKHLDQSPNPHPSQAVGTVDSASFQVFINALSTATATIASTGPLSLPHPPHYNPFPFHYLLLAPSTVDLTTPQPCCSAPEASCSFGLKPAGLCEQLPSFPSSSIFLTHVTHDSRPSQPLSETLLCHIYIRLEALSIVSSCL